jgi:hypothetical protein
VSIGSPAARELAARLGLHRSGREWRGGCPLCGYLDALVLGTGRGGAPLLWCASCDDRDGLRALLRVDGSRLPDFPHYRPRRTDSTNIQSGIVDAAARRQREAEQRERALGLWRGSRSAVGTIAERYLAARGLPGLATSSALRFRPDCPHPAGGRLPAMVALVTDAGGEPIAIARTFLRHDGSAKADIEPPRATLGPIRGGAVRLDPAAPELVIGEGNRDQRIGRAVDRVARLGGDLGGQSRARRGATGRGA